MTDDSNRSDARITRRSVLRSVAAGATTAGGLAGLAAGRTSVASERVDDRAALDVIERHGADVLAELAATGHLDAPRAAALADAGRDGATRATRRPDGAVRYETTTSDGRLAVIADPSDGSQHAVLVPDAADADEVAVFDPDTAAGGPAACTFVTACVTADDTCDTSRGCAEYTVACCDDGYCYLDDETGVRCACDICVDGCSSVYA
jgi:hypothetical protein